MLGLQARRHLCAVATMAMMPTPTPIQRSKRAGFSLSMKYAEVSCSDDLGMRRLVAGTWAAGPLVHAHCPGSHPGNRVLRVGRLVDCRAIRTWDVEQVLPSRSW